MDKSENVSHRWLEDAAAKSKLGTDPSAEASLEGAEEVSGPAEPTAERNVAAEDQKAGEGQPGSRSLRVERDGRAESNPSAAETSLEWVEVVGSPTETGSIIEESMAVEDHKSGGDQPGSSILPVERDILTGSGPSTAETSLEGAEGVGNPTETRLIVEESSAEENQASEGGQPVSTGLPLDALVECSSFLYGRC